MTNTIKLLDVVALTVDLPEYNLWRGQVGTVVEVLAEGNAFEVEFSDREGHTFKSLGQSKSQDRKMKDRKIKRGIKPQNVSRKR